MRNALIGVVMAVAAALVAADVRLFGIEAWKIGLALIGLGIFRSAARDHDTRDRHVPQKLTKDQAPSDERRS